MKGSSRARAPSSPESEESWTVDCPCGVNYDDGEEMVDCDECGVWVHTGCCRILKGHTSYVCDKCKFKKKKESEESEVAQLLVELPSKTPPLEETVFTLRTELSREERAHVQGIPGGDPSFFVGVAPVFSRQLWKYTGYVPKVFQFNYSDLPQEKTDACVLFADFSETKAEVPTLDYVKDDNQIDEGKLVSTGLLPLGEAHAEKYYFSKDKHNKRDIRKETKHRVRDQQEDCMKSHYHSKRRRDENTKKDYTNKKRSRIYGVDDYQGTPRRTYDESTTPLKSARIASRNSKIYTAYNSGEDADAYARNTLIYSTKVEELGPHSLGLYSRERGLTDSSFRKQLATKAARKVAPVSFGRTEQDGSNGSHRPDSVSLQETHIAHKELDGVARNKFAVNKNDRDVSKSRDQVGSSGHTEGKAGSAGYSQFTLSDAKENSPRVRSNGIDATNDHPDETLLEPYLIPVNEKLGKHHSNEDADLAARSQYLSQKHEEHESSADVSHADDDHPRSVRVTNETCAADSSHISTDQPDAQVLWDDGNCPYLVLPAAPSPAQHASWQDVEVASSTALTVSKGAVETLQVVDETTKESPKFVKTGPSQSAGLSSPSLSGPGVDSKQLGSMKVDSISVASLTTDMGSPPISNTKACSSLVSKGGTSLANSQGNSNSTSKLRSKTHELKKADLMPGDLNEASTNISLPKDVKELLKGAGTGKCLAARASSHQKTQLSHPSAAKQNGQLLMDSGSHANALDQSLLQNKYSLKPLSTSLSHKLEKAQVSGPKSTAVLLSPSHASTLDVLMQDADSVRPAMNDEELALLLHQELNSSPRVTRVARVRQGGTGAHPFSTKRSPMANSPVASTATQKDPHLIFRRKNREDMHGEVCRGADELIKAEVGGSVKQESGSMTHIGSRKDKDIADVTKVPSSSTAIELNKHPSPGSVGFTERQPRSDSSFGAADLDDGERRTSADSILTLPGLIEDILNEKGANASYDLICDEVLPHWSKLRKHNGERYAYTSHRQAVLDCLRNRSAWSHLIDRGPKTNLGRKRRRPESAVASESEHAEHSSHLHDAGDDHIAFKASKEYEVDLSENWPLSDSNKDTDLSLPEEVPKGKRKARRGRRLTPQSRGYEGKAHYGRGEQYAQGTDDDFEHMVSPFSEEPASSSEDEDIFVHRGAVRPMGRHQASSVDSEDDDVDL